MPGKLDGSREPVRVMKPEEVKITLGKEAPAQAESVPAPSGEPAPGSAVEKPPEATPPAANPEQVSPPEAKPGEQAAPESQPNSTPPATETPKEEEKSSTQTEAAAPAGEQLALATEAIAPVGGTFKGVVRVDGAFPTLPPLSTNAKEGCPAPDVADESVLVGPDGGLQNVLVWLKKVPDGVTPPAASSTPVIVDQKSCAFTPRVVGLQLGQPIRFTNSDSTSHNVHTNPFSNVGVNRSVPASDAVGLAVNYETAEQRPVLTVCDIHAWMRSYHLVLDHPWFTVTDSTGEFSIAGLPAGDLEFSLWGEKGFVAKSVKLTIKPGETISQDFVVPVANLQKK